MLNLLPRWAATRWPAEVFYSARDVSGFVESQQLESDIQTLENALYGKQQNEGWHGGQLAATLKVIRKADLENQNPASSTALPPLSPV